MGRTQADYNIYHYVLSSTASFDPQVRERIVKGYVHDNPGRNIGLFLWCGDRL